jgi:putative radical SAM enzyme (TIGR03279 family)
MGAEIAGVAAGGIAAEVGLQSGDVLAAIDGRPVEDILDYQYRTFPDRLRLRVIKPGGEEWDIGVEKDPGEPLGLTLAGEVYDGVRECGNHCFFCFVNQLPPGLRDSLYVKDDDFRLSILHGNFVTLTNLTPSDLARIREQRLSPIRVSIHATDPELRALMLGNPRAAPVLPLLAELTGLGLEVHGQIVLCPGVNDGQALEDTLSDLAQLVPPLASLALVPVGVTRHARGKLRPFHAGEAAHVLAVLEQWRYRYRDSGAPPPQASDELYLLADREPPPLSYYGDFPQLDNGVGMLRWFTHEWRMATRRLRPVAETRRVLILTGRLFEPWLRREMARMSGVDGLVVDVTGCDNRLFGETVTVAGLLGGEDLMRGFDTARVVGGGQAWDQVLVPPQVLRAEADLTLDGWSLDELGRRMGTTVSAPPSPAELARTILGFSYRKAVSG